MPTKEYQIEELKDKIAYLQDLYNRIEKADYNSTILGAIIMWLIDLEKRLKSLEGKND